MVAAEKWRGLISFDVFLLQEQKVTLDAGVSLHVFCKCVFLHVPFIVVNVHFLHL
jgi:hypothetical protein